MVRTVVHHTNWPHVISRKEVHQNFGRASPMILMPLPPKKVIQPMQGVDCNRFCEMLSIILPL